MLKHFTPDRVAKNNTIGGALDPCLTEDEIFRYVFHEIPEEERFRIEKHLTSCDLCHEAVEGADKFGSEIELRKQVDRVREDIRKKYRHLPESKRSPRLIYYSAAALILIAFSGIGYWMTRDTNKQLADAYITPYSNMIPLSRGANKRTLIEEAMTYYEAENYSKAERALDQFLKERPDDLTAHLYCGISALLSGDAPEALIHLEKASGSADARIKDAAQWYEALAYLKLGKARAAAELLKNIADKGGFFSESAQSILSQIQIE